jgi:hypothetical protein
VSAFPQPNRVKVAPLSAVKYRLGDHVAKRIVALSKPKGAAHILKRSRYQRNVLWLKIAVLEESIDRHVNSSTA